METQQTPFGYAQASLQTWFKAAGLSLQTMESLAQAISQGLTFSEVNSGQTVEESVQPFSKAEFQSQIRLD